MDAELLINRAKEAANLFISSNDADRYAFRVGYLEATVRELTDLLDQSEQIMYQQRNLLEKIKKGFSADL
jgi:t-SNARE complex subunit (syntaxin)